MRDLPIHPLEDQEEPQRLELYSLPIPIPILQHLLNNNNNEACRALKKRVLQAQLSA